MNDLVTSDEAQNCEIWALGDDNMNLRKRNSPHCKLFFDFLRQTGLRNLTTEITRPTFQGGSSIDHIITNCNMNIPSGVLDDYISDHLVIYACRKKTRQEYKSCTFKGRSYRKYNKLDFQDHLIYTNWDQLYKSTDPNVQWEAIERIIASYLDRVCPLKELSFNRAKAKWMTHDIVELIEERKENIRLYKATLEEVYLNEARRLRNLISTRIKAARSEYWLNEVEENMRDHKKFWRRVNQILNPKENTLCPNLIHHETGNEVPPKEAPQYINEYFASVGETLANVILNQGLPQDNDSQEVPNPGAPKIPQLIITDDMVDRVVKEIDISKSSGFEGINSRVLRDAFEVISHQLTHIFNTSIEYGIFPNAWSLANLVPIPKSGNLNSITNWRPISRLPLPGKLIEKIVQKHMLEFLESNNLFDNSQHGFRPGRGTANAVFDFVNELYDARDEGRVVATCFVDFRKAFDCVSHPLLIKKIENIGIDGKILLWTKSYLRDRLQRTTICNEQRL